tara:strand:+ start:780 stop:1331 length:552 start_codon:yes stop_codon:yes gene_type:complete
MAIEIEKIEEARVGSVFANADPQALFFESVTSNKVDKLIPALILAKKEMGSRISTDSRNPHFKNEYTSLESLLEKISGPLTNNGLFLVQQPTGHHLINTIYHTSGQFIQSKYKLMAEKQTPQGVGSAITYARRYSISALFMLASDPKLDDDAETAEGRGINVPPKSGRGASLSIAGGKTGTDF